MTRVILESPYAGRSRFAPLRWLQRLHNIWYARRALADSLARGEAPLASHLLYTQVLNDRDPNQRVTGILAGLAWGTVAECTVVYRDLGISPGMRYGIERAENENRPVEYRTLWSNEP